MRNSNNIIMLCLILITPFIGKTQFSNSMYLNDKVENDIQNEIKREHYKKNNVYFELFGNGVYYSLGYERILMQGSRSGFSLAHGITFLQRSNNNFLYLSPQMNYFYGEKHHFEIGLGLTYCVIQVEETKYIFYRIGYRYQKQGGSFFYKIALTPYTMLKTSGWNLPPIFPSMGFTIGYAF